MGQKKVVADCGDNFLCGAGRGARRLLAAEGRGARVGVPDRRAAAAATMRAVAARCAALRGFLRAGGRGARFRGADRVLRAGSGREDGRLRVTADLAVRLRVIFFIRLHSAETNQKRKRNLPHRRSARCSAADVWCGALWVGVG